MKVKDLIEELLKADPKAEVIIQKDAEGNGYSPCSGADLEAVYIPYTTYSGDVYDTKWTAEEADMGHDEWEEILAKPRCVVLSPIN